MGRSRARRGRARDPAVRLARRSTRAAACPAGPPRRGADHRRDAGEGARRSGAPPPSRRDPGPRGADRRRRHRDHRDRGATRVLRRTGMDAGPESPGRQARAPDSASVIPVLVDLLVVPELDRRRGRRRARAQAGRDRRAGAQRHELAPPRRRAAARHAVLAEQLPRAEACTSRSICPAPLRAGFRRAPSASTRCSAASP